jgi:hypothetical protein
MNGNDSFPANYNFSFNIDTPCSYICVVCNTVYTTGVESIWLTGKPYICPACKADYGGPSDFYDNIPGLTYENKIT